MKYPKRVVVQNKSNLLLIFYTTQEHYKYLQLINPIKARNYLQMIIKGPA